MGNKQVIKEMTRLTEFLHKEFPHAIVPDVNLIDLTIELLKAGKHIATQRDAFEQGKLDSQYITWLENQVDKLHGDHITIHRSIFNKIILRKSKKEKKLSSKTLRGLIQGHLSLQKGI